MNKFNPIERTLINFNHLLLPTTKPNAITSPCLYVRLLTKTHVKEILHCALFSAAHTSALINHSIHSPYSISPPHSYTALRCGAGASIRACAYVLCVCVCTLCAYENITFSSKVRILLIFFWFVICPSFECTHTNHNIFCLSIYFSLILPTNVMMLISHLHTQSSMYGIHDIHA